MLPRSCPDALNTRFPELASISKVLSFAFTALTIPQSNLLAYCADDSSNDFGIQDADRDLFFSSHFVSIPRQLATAFIETYVFPSTTSDGQGKIG